MSQQEIYNHDYEKLDFYEELHELSEPTYHPLADSGVQQGVSTQPPFSIAQPRHNAQRDSWLTDSSQVMIPALFSHQSIVTENPSVETLAGDEVPQPTVAQDTPPKKRIHILACAQITIGILCIVLETVIMIYGGRYFIGFWASPFVRDRRSFQQNGVVFVDKSNT